MANFWDLDEGHVLEAIQSLNTETDNRRPYVLLLGGIWFLGKAFPTKIFKKYKE